MKELLQQLCSEGWATERGFALPYADHVIALATHRDAMWVRREFGVNILDAVPHESFCEKFREIRWPHAVAYAEERYSRSVRTHFRADAPEQLG